MSAYGCIYLLTSPSGKHYVGQTIEDFESYFRNHYVNRKGDKRAHLNKAILKYGIENFTKNVLVFCYSKDDLDKAEIGFIEMYDSIKNGYNIREGGSRGKFSSSSYIFSEEYRGKRREMQLGKLNSIETRSKISHSKEKYIYTVLTPSNEKIEVRNLHKFCKDVNPHRSGISNGRFNGFKILSKLDLSSGVVYKYNHDIIRYKYTLMNPYGEEVTCFNLSKLCSEYSLNQSNLNNQGKTKGWTLLSKTKINEALLGEVTA